MNTDQIAKASNAAFFEMQSKTSAQRASLLRDMATEIEEIGEVLLQTASEESNLPVARFEGERNRTCAQLRMFADFIEDGTWHHGAIDIALPERKPLPRPELRMYKLPIGPIVVFGASNFPLAYSTAGGDTASAIAAGCSVIYKAHPAHSKTSLMVAEAIYRAIARNNFPKDTFIHFVANSFDQVESLVRSDEIQGIGFTGSVKGGLAIYEYTKARRQPIPVFAEMGSVNPVTLLPMALDKEAEKWADAYAAAITMGVGQFCTNPGILLTVKGKGLDAFTARLSHKIAESKDFKMLHEGIFQNYENRKLEVLHEAGVKKLAEGVKTVDYSGIPMLAIVEGRDYLDNPILHEEVFGPFSMIVCCENTSELKSVLSNFEGQLTASVIFDAAENELAREVLNIVKYKVGRIVVNGVPTGVEVCDAMVHGGPFPATTDARFSSVGSSAINRWIRPICYQNCPGDLLPYF